MLTVRDVIGINCKRNNILIVLLFISFFAEAKIKSLSMIGGAATFAIPVMILIMYSKKIFVDKNNKLVAILFGLYMLLQVVNFRYGSFYYLSRDVINLYRTFSMFIVTLFARKCKFTQKNIRLFTLLTFLLCVIGFVSLNFPNPDGSDKVFGNYNTLGAIYFTLALAHVCLFTFGKKIMNLGAAAVCVLIVNLSKTRSAVILLLLFVMGYFIVKHFFTKRKWERFIYFGFFAMIIGAIFVYYNIGNFEFLKPIDEFFVKYFGKNLDSGRPRLWKFAVSLLNGSLLFGLGTGASLSEYNIRLASTHSTYFEVLLQSGIVGLILYCSIIIAVVFSKRKGDCDNKSVYIGVVLVGVILFYNAVGLIFIRARSGMGLMQWFLLSIPYGIFSSQSHTESKSFLGRGRYVDQRCGPRI